ncbi:PREDICTED: M-phase inducer phosphatase [Habropoda laboriosa]|uniref:M-phase inducer phosphatase n=1 Tax=Habropoda laboriosa TaxID=597456 RepID=UPI00083DA40E|nr:PREDICTED: M-phase inducer phosphatase [Habropoda laboriosa]
MSGLKRVSILSRIAELDESSPKKCEKEAVTVLVSPISGIVRGLMNSSLSSQNCSKGSNNRRNDVARELDHHRVMYTAYTDYSFIFRLFKNAFKIKSTPENTIKSKPKSRRLLGMASRRFSSPDRVSPSIDKENNSAACSPHGVSPQKIGCAKKFRHPLEDCDPNSQDSGYEASYPEKEEKTARDGFRFAEPLAVAPRRMSIESRSPMESPVRSSPQRTRIARPSLFRSLSSGYESMDDGFNDLIDVENLDDATQLPNGISTLLCGDIVSAIDAGIIEPGIPDACNPSTPEFSRTSCSSGNLRRSVSLQNERVECRKNTSSSSLSKVRSCLFRSPNASSSTTNPGFDDSSPLATTMPVARRRRIAEEIADGKTVISNSSSPLHFPLSIRTFKRPEPPIDESPKLVKRSRKLNTFLDIVRKNDVADITMFNAKCVRLQRSLSEMATASTIGKATMKMETEAETETEMQSVMETHAHIKSAIYRSTTDADLTGDFSKQCVLPLATGNHEDLKSISADTLASLIRGEFSDVIGSFKIVDCRYPYEFDAGHIEGALNLYSKDLIEHCLLDPLTSTPEIKPDTNAKRNILVFHCEFSWERGPNLSRFLRNLDRQRNKEHYPALHYPELYLLHGGYEQFYREQKGLCSPQGYRPMRHPDHEADLRQFRSKSKSWQGEKSRIGGCTVRTNLKSLGF